MLNNTELIHYTAHKGYDKVHKPLIGKAILSFIGGAMIGLGYLANIRIAATLTGELEGLGTLLGASVFPIGLVVILLAGGELVTGNIMAVAMAYLNKEVTFKEMITNWLEVLFFNALGAIAVAYFFGYVTELLTSGPYLETLTHYAQKKVNASALSQFVSGVGCNWFVALAVYLSYISKDVSGKILAIWFPVMTFVLIGFQHSVANLFLLPAYAMMTNVSLLSIASNIFWVFLGNCVGGGICVSAFYYWSYQAETAATK